ncbi:MAG: DUF1207 domain-containing protein [Ignavibacteriae bacterium]|nr:DUF1207 domain-containing protein [Ignavibacteriota bacterium]
MKKIITVIIILYFLFIHFSYNSFALEGHLFPSPAANILEPGIGTVFELSAKKLRLDIGTSVDLMEFNSGEQSIIRIGTDFFTLSRLRSEGNMKFPVETADYFFGVNSTTKGKIYGFDYSARLRLAHISSHIVDGMATDTILRFTPFVYSREFAELTGAISIDKFRFYAGLTYVFSRQPKSTNAVIPQIGIDSKFGINSYLKVCLGYDLRLSGYDNNYFGSNTVLAGIEIMVSGETGIMLFFNAHSGKSIHGMFYKEDESFSGIGFRIDF